MGTSDIVQPDASDDAEPGSAAAAPLAGGAAGPPDDDAGSLAPASVAGFAASSAHFCAIPTYGL